MSTPSNIAGSGVFLGTHFSYVNDGGDGGKGGKGGLGGKEGQGAQPGNKTQLCNDALHGTDGQKGDPQDINLTVDGPAGGHGLGASLTFEPVKTGTCADQIPLPPPTITNVSPATGAQGTMGLAMTITGTGFILGATVDVTGTGVTANPPSAVTGTQINCTFDIGNLAAKTGRNVTVKNPGGATSAPLVNGFTVT